MTILTTKLRFIERPKYDGEHYQIQPKIRVLQQYVIDNVTGQDGWVDVPLVTEEGDEPCAQ